MPHPTDTRADERHQDFEEMHRLLGTIKKAMVFVTGAFITAIIPLMVVGVVVLIENNQNQKAMAREFVEWKAVIKERQDKQELYNEKTTVMWHAGRWQEAHKTEN